MKVNQNVLRLIRSKKSINSISKITGLGKSTVYYHYKKVMGKKIKEVSFNFKNKNQIGEFMGIFAGDGNFTKYKDGHYTIRISIGYYEKHYSENLKEMFSKWFNKKPYVYYQKKNNIPTVVILEYHSKKIYSFIINYLHWNNKKTYTIKLKNLNINNREFNLGFLRGLIDTDGTYYVPKNRIAYSTVSKDLVNQVYSIIKENLGIKPNLMVYRKIDRAPLYTIYLQGVSAKKIIDEISPRNINKNYK